MQNTDKLLQVKYNGATVFSQPRQRLPGHMRSALERLDEQLRAGLTLEGRFLAEPDHAQRMQYVVNMLGEALRRQRADVSELMCLYLARYHPEITVLRLTDDGQTLRAELE